MKTIKHVLLPLAILEIFLLGALPLHAADNRPGQPESGLSYTIQAGAVMIQTDSQLVPDDNNRTIASLNGSGEPAEAVFPALLLDARYRLASGTTVYLKTPLEGGYGVASGLVHSFDTGALDVYGYYGLPSDVWQDPYLTGAPRTETDENNCGGGVRFNRIMGTGLGIEYRLLTRDVDQDVIGNRIPDLKRDGRIHRFGLQYAWRAAGGVWTPKIFYTLGDVDGGANAYDEVTGGVAYMRATDRYVFQIDAKVGSAVFDKRHPVFLQDREDAVYCVTAIYSWLSPFDQERFSVNFLAGYETTDSNIDFFDRSDMVAGITIGYAFGK